MTSRPSTAAPIRVAIALVLLMSSYLAAYLRLGERTDIAETATIQRHYTSTWLPRIFAPAAVVEHWLTGRNVHLIGQQRF